MASSKTIKAIAVATGFTSSATGAAAYTIQTQAAQPAFVPAPGAFTAAQSVKITEATAGAAVYYTTDGALPTAKSIHYTGAAIPVSKTTTLRAIALANGAQPSAVATGLFAVNNATLVAERALAFQGLGLGLATQTFLSQLSLSQNTLLFGPDGCADASQTLLSLTTTGHTGGMTAQQPSAEGMPGFGTIFYDNACTQPWEKAELYNWQVNLDLAQLSLRGTTDETSNFYSTAGKKTGQLSISEAITLAMQGDTAAAGTFGTGTFTPANGGPSAQLALSCTVDLLGFLNWSEQSFCSGGIAQNLPALSLEMGFALPITFTPTTLPGMLWDGTQFVAPAAAGFVYTSKDGKAWAAHSAAAGLTLMGAATHGTTLVAVGSRGTIRTSTNAGASWTARTSGATARLSSVAWSGKQFIAIGAAKGKFVSLTSPDGSVWTLHTTTIPIVVPPHLACSSTLCVATADQHAALTTDGANWTTNPRPIDSYTNARDIAWSGTEFVLVGTDGAPYGFPDILSSTDGKTWNSLGLNYNGPQQPLLGVAWSPAKKLWVAVGNQGLIVTSPDAVKWTKQTSGTTVNLSSVAWGGTQFAAIGAGNVVLTSPNGIAWTPQTNLPGQGRLLLYSSSGSAVSTGNPGALNLGMNAQQAVQVSGGSSFASGAFSGFTGDLSVFVPSPTGWTVTDQAHGEKFIINESATRVFSGTIIATAGGKALATFTVDRGGNGAITYSDAKTAPVVNWLPQN